MLAICGEQPSAFLEDHDPAKKRDSGTADLPAVPLFDEPDDATLAAPVDHVRDGYPELARHTLGTRVQKTGCATLGEATGRICHALAEGALKDMSEAPVSPPGAEPEVFDTLRMDWAAVRMRAETANDITYSPKGTPVRRSDGSAPQLCDFGSRVSRSPSPSMLNPSTARKIATAGMRTNHGAISRY